MKIVHLVPALGKGGAERVAVDLANYQSSQGHIVTVVAGSEIDERLLRRDLHPVIEVEYVGKSTGRLSRYVAAVGWLIRRKRWWADQDLIHLHMTFAAVVGTIIYGFRNFSRSATPKIVETYHAVGMPISPWRRWIHARMAGCRDGLILMAEDRFWKDFVSRRPALPSTVIPNGLARPAEGNRADAAVRAYAAAAAMNTDARLTLGSIGRLVHERQPARYVPIFAEVAAVLGSDVQFLLAGEGPERGAIERGAKRSGVADRLHMPGLARDASLPRALIDLYLTVNVGPVTGISGLEAALCGVPVIAIQLLPEYCRGPDDWVWSSSNDHEVAGEAVRLLRDSAARRALAARQKAHVETHFSIAAMAQDYDQFYARVGTARAGSRSIPQGIS